MSDVFSGENLFYFYCQPQLQITANWRPFVSVYSHATETCNTRATSLCWRCFLQLMFACCRQYLCFPHRLYLGQIIIHHLSTSLVQLALCFDCYQTQTHPYSVRGVRLAIVPCNATGPLIGGEQLQNLGGQEITNIGLPTSETKQTGEIVD